MRSDEKITATEILDEIANSVRRELAKNDVFNNDSLCYSGCRFEFEIKIQLVSRGESELNTQFERVVGDASGPTVTPVEASGERIAGRRGKRHHENKPDDGQ